MDGINAVMRKFEATKDEFAANPTRNKRKLPRVKSFENAPEYLEKLTPEREIFRESKYDKFKRTKADARVLQVAAKEEVRKLQAELRHEDKRRWNAVFLRAE